MKILLLGSNGQLGSAMLALSRQSKFPIGWEMVAWDRSQADLSKVDELLPKIEAFAPDAIINSTAYTQVDLAEKEQELCEKVNAEAPTKIAALCARKKIPIIHFSTDYVYSGEGTEPHVESEKTNPVNFYGASKARGEEGIAASGADHLIFRTSWVFNETGKNFVNTMLRLGADRDELKVVGDQYGAPTYAHDLALYSLDAFMIGLEKKVDQKFPSGIYHLCNSGVTTWCDFAKAILPGKKIHSIPSSEFPTPAKRPSNSRMSLEKFKKTFGIEPRSWDQALNECLNNKGIHR